MGKLRTELLEDHLDEVGLDALLRELAEIAFLKSVHLSANWQDEKAAKAWVRAGVHIEHLATGSAVQAVNFPKSTE